MSQKEIRSTTVRLVKIVQQTEWARKKSKIFLEEATVNQSLLSPEKGPSLGGPFHAHRR